MRLGCPWALGSTFASKNAQSEEQNPVCRGIAETFELCQKCWPRGRAGLLDVAGIFWARRCWRGCWWWRGAGGRWGRQSMLGPALAGDSSWWQAPPLLGGECLPFVSWPVNSLLPYLTSSICFQPSIIPLPSRRRGERAVESEESRGTCLLAYTICREGGVYCTRHAARLSLQKDPV